ncbi:MAG: dioxygenase [Chloroflexi bacterium]|nr:dioxygenase [Chloroflexota bacterium]
MRQARVRNWFGLTRLCGAIALVLALTACSAAPIAQTAVPDPTATTAPAANVPPTIAPPTAAPTATAPTANQPPAATDLPAAPTATVEAALPAPQCNGLTPAQTEGPYYTPDTPERTSLIEPEMTGTKLKLTGYVLDANCRPIANAWLDFWQADDEGEYDNAGYVMRGHQFTDANGRYQLETVLPGLYPGRTRHIHVKVQAPNGPILTSQIYFPGEPANAGDGIFDPALIADVQTTADGLSGTFNFVINTK